MGCQKLTYQTTEPSLKVVYRKSVKSENIAQRFLSVDPLTSEYPFWSPYHFSGNNPIQFVDRDGLEVWFLLGTSNTPLIEVVTKVSIETGVKNTVEIGTKVTEVAVKTSEAAAKTAEASKPQMNQQAIRQGRATEAKQLERLGLEKNNKSSTVKDAKSGEEVTTIPDAVRPSGQTVEIKGGSSKQSLTKQLRAQEKISNEAGQKPQLYLPEGKPTTQPLENSTFDIQRFTPVTVPADNTNVVTPTPKIDPSPTLPSKSASSNPYIS